jgi:hypothetical protein
VALASSQWFIGKMPMLPRPRMKMSIEHLLRYGRELNAMDQVIGIMLAHHRDRIALHTSA